MSLENVHKTVLRPWIAEAINVRAFRDKWSYALRDFNACLPKPGVSFTDKMMKSIQQPEVIEKLVNECGEAALTCPGDDEIDLQPMFDIPEGVDLETLKFQKIEMCKRRSDYRYGVLMSDIYKFHNYPPSEPSAKKFGPVTKMTSNKVEMPDVVLTVQIFRPEIAHHHYQKQAHANHAKFFIHQEMCVLGCQYLTELRDQINCVSDMAVRGDFSHNPLQEMGIKFKDTYKSGFFFINGVFYNDMRESACKDLSEIIIKWANSTNRKIGPFTSTSMETAQFINLELQLGYPYVYVHQGNCEHLIVFCDLRMLSQDDSLSLNDYPMINRFILKRRTLCMACHRLTTRWVVAKNERLPEDPYFFCDDCFHSFNYTDTGEKIGSFEARKYFDHSMLL